MRGVASIDSDAPPTTTLLDQHAPMHEYRENNSQGPARRLSVSFDFQKYSWRLARLKHMGLGEIAWRCQTQVKTALQSSGLLTAARTPSPDFSKDSIAWINRSHILDSEPYVTAADKLLTGHLVIFGLPSETLGRDRLWNQDPITGIHAPLTFGKSLDYRDPHLVGDIKYLWEPARHLQLVTLAQAYHLTGNSKYLDGIRNQLDSWFEQCPYLRGPHWTSSLELAIRLINWSLVWQLIDGLRSPLFADSAGNQFRDRWLTSIYQHVHFIQGHLSKHSSANNHLIGEAAGLYISTKTWPYWSIFQRWSSRAATLLETQIQKQHTLDGVNREQAIAYQQFVLDFLILSVLTANANGCAFSSIFTQAIERMMEFIASIMDVGGNTPMIGDADDGFVIQLSQPPGDCPFKSLLATASVLFSRADLKVKSGGFDQKSQWLLGDSASRKYADISAADSNFPPKKAFPDGGYYILGDRFETPQEVRIIPYAAPLGYLSIAAHGHADALALHLSVAGQELLVDPGTYCYHSKTKWRNYFRGTSAHNTVRVDGQDQAQIAGNFMWQQTVNTRCEAWSTSDLEDSFSASHDGYQRFPDPVSHQRNVRYFKPSNTIRVIDKFHCQSKHTIEIFWHFSERCVVTQQRDAIHARAGSAAITLSLVSSPVLPAVTRGQTQPPLGWISRKFGHKVPTSTAMWRLDISGNTEVVTEIHIDICGDAGS